MGVHHSNLLQLVHPGRRVEIYRQPVIAADIMKKYPRHCIARPDVFQFPWIAVRPESILVPGKKFYLVPFHTMRKLLEERKPQSTRNQSRPHDRDRRYSPTKSMAGGTPKHSQHERYYRTDYYDYEDREYYDNSDYKSSFFKSWNTAREKLYRGGDELYEIDSSFDGFVMSNPRPRVTSPERDDVRLRSCVRKPDSNRKLLTLKVSFTSQTIIPNSPRDSPRGLQQQREKF